MPVASKSCFHCNQVRAKAQLESVGGLRVAGWKNGKRGPGLRSEATAGKLLASLCYSTPFGVVKKRKEGEGNDSDSMGRSTHGYG